MKMNAKKVLAAVIAVTMCMMFAACGGTPEPVATDSGAISVTPLDMADYITEANEGKEEILMAKEGDGYGAG